MISVRAPNRLDALLGAPKRFHGLLCGGSEPGQLILNQSSDRHAKFILREPVWVVIEGAIHYPLDSPHNYKRRSPYPCPTHTGESDLKQICQAVFQNGVGLPHLSCPINARNLLPQGYGEHDVRFTPVHYGINQATHGYVQRLFSNSLEEHLQGAPVSADLLLNECCNNGLLVRKVLVKRSNAHTSPARDHVCAESRVPILCQNVSRCLQNSISSDPGPILFRFFAWPMAVVVSHRFAYPNVSTIGVTRQLATGII